MHILSSFGHSQGFFTITTIDARNDGNKQSQVLFTFRIITTFLFLCHRLDETAEGKAKLNMLLVVPSNPNISFLGLTHPVGNKKLTSYVSLDDVMCDVT